MATYAVGDLQGCLEPLLRLLERVQFSDGDKLWLAGDLVNRGPQSLATLRFVISMGNSARVVLGNHDLHLLALHHGATNLQADPTLTPILSAPDREDLMTWLQSLPLLHYSKQYNTVMTHAGIPPCWDLHTAQCLAKELHQVLTSHQQAEYFAHMYGDLPDLWQPDLSGPARWRCITNYFTRMRFTTPQGRLELTTKAKPDSAPKGFAPWFTHPSLINCRQIFGHWAALEGETGSNTIINLDMGYVWGGHLKMLRLDDGEVFTTACS
ncbi:MAG: symmetrical bis(5'-nucleosyl)-tetraphosphatase [Gammaproteobacteria bacterium]|jgi:bis(5'-nucleosyl)-tetraphosphatase (symmetrical)|nr:symmetrical bis(5'-nucleosyl)-tetraphosphatase [Gammaproteobacteria bacterium]